MGEGELEGLHHDIEHGNDFIAATAQANLDTAPQLSDDDMFYMSAFYELGTERPSGMGFSPIPFSKILEYAKFIGLNEAERDTFYRIMRTIDGKLCMILNEKAKAKQNSS